jgi:hypothetical protein
MKLSSLEQSKALNNKYERIRFGLFVRLKNNPSAAVSIAPT